MIILIISLGGNNGSYLCADNGKSPLKPDSNEEMTAFERKQGEKAGFYPKSLCANGG